MLSEPHVRAWCVRFLSFLPFSSTSWADWCAPPQGPDARGPPQAFPPPPPDRAQHVSRRRRGRRRRPRGGRRLPGVVLQARRERAPARGPRRIRRRAEDVARQGARGGEQARAGQGASASRPFFFFFFFFSSRRGRLPETDWSRLGPALPPSPTTDSCATAAGQPRVCDTLCAVHAAARDRPRLSSSRVALSIFPPPLHAVTTLSFSSRPLHPHPLPQPLSIFPAFSRWQHLQPRKGTCAVSHSLAPVQLVLEASQRRGESDAGNYRDGKAGACEGDP